MPRPTRAELEAARALTVPDVLPGPGDPSLAVLFCGINPGLVTALTGHPLVGNRFWPALHPDFRSCVDRLVRGFGV